MARSILVPLDGSSFSEQALPAAMWLARRAQVPLRLVQIHVPVAILPFAGSTPVDAQAERRLREREREYLNELAGRVSAEAGVQCTGVLLDGPVIDTIDDYARQFGVEMVVMTTHGRGGFSRLWLGSVADGLVRRSTVPILLIRPEDHETERPGVDGFRRILVPLDGSELAEQILPHAIALARLADGELVLVRVVTPYVVTDFVTERPGVLPPTVFTEPRVRLAEEELGRVAERLSIEEGITVSTRVVEHTQPAAGILEEAERTGADLIAAATHGRGGIARLVLGSVADKLIRAARVPVLVVRPQAK